MTDAARLSRVAVLYAALAAPAAASPETRAEARWTGFRLSAAETGMAFDQAGVSYGNGGYDQSFVATCTSEADGGPVPEVALISLDAAPRAADDGRTGMVFEVDGLRVPTVGRADPQDPARVMLSIKTEDALWQDLRRGSDARVVFDGGATVPLDLMGSGRVIGAFIDACRAFAVPAGGGDDLAARVLGWAPDGEGLSGPDGVMMALAGRWRSVDDPRSEIVIDPFGPNGPTHAFVYDGGAETPKPAGFGGACEGPLADEPLGYFAVGAENPLCYGIERLTEDYLEMTFLGARLNVHRFERVSDMASPESPPAPGATEDSCIALGGLRSEAWDEPVSIRVTNEGAAALEVFWIDYDGARQPVGTLMPGEGFAQETYVTHPWEFTDASGTCVEIVLPEAGRREYAVEK